MQRMSITAHQVHYTYAEYLAVERYSDLRHEYLDGQIYAMAGGTREHSALFTAVATLLLTQLRGRCRVHAADQRVRTQSGLSTYPDVAVICGPAEVHSEDADAVTNPTLIIEVLSPSTEQYDRGDKFAHYKTLDSLRQYVLVSQRERSLEVWTRGTDDRWRATIFGEHELVELSVGARLNVRELYEMNAEPSA